MIIIINYENMTFRFCVRRHSAVFLRKVIPNIIYLTVTYLLSVQITKSLTFFQLLLLKISMLVEVVSGGVVGAYKYWSQHEFFVIPNNFLYIVE